jgi:hypothetical protein
MRMKSVLASLAAATLLAGCAAQVPPAQVTRFHLSQPIAPAEIAVEPRDPTLADDLEFQAYAGMVAGELRRLGFAPQPGLKGSELVAVMAIDQMSRPAGAARSPFSIGIGGGTFGGNVGVGGGVSFPVGKAKQNYVTATQLSVQIKRRSDNSVIWEGRAQGEARDGTPYATGQAAVQRLANALFKDFPGESGRTVSVK